MDSASLTTECAKAFESLGRFLRGLRFRPFGQPPSLAFSLAALVFALDVALPPSRPSATAAGFFCIP